MKVYSIYKATNVINNKVYIGFDSCWPNRIQQHKYNSTKRPQKFYCAIRKYGWDNFTWELIYQSYDLDHTLNEMENFFILEYDSLNNGYNTTLGGTAPMLGLKIPTETRIKMSMAIKKFWSTDEGQILKSSIQKNNWTIPSYREKYEKNYIVINPKGDQFKVKNLKKFCIENNLPHSNMYKVANGKRKTCCGWIAYKI